MNGLFFRHPKPDIDKEPALARKARKAVALTANDDEVFIAATRATLCLDYAIIIFYSFDPSMIAFLKTL